MQFEHKIELSEGDEFPDLLGLADRIERGLLRSLYIQGQLILSNDEDKEALKTLALAAKEKKWTIFVGHDNCTWNPECLVLAEVFVKNASGATGEKLSVLELEQIIGIVSTVRLVVFTLLVVAFV